jgi:hypothetical protein
MAKAKRTLSLKTPSAKPTKKAAPRAKRSAKGGNASAASSKGEKTLRNRGIISNMRVMEYQDHTLDINHKTDRRLSDEKLAKDWAREFPNSSCMQRRETKIVRGVRTLYNKGRHRSGVGIPSRVSVPYDDKGQPIQKQSKKSTAKAA